MFVRIFRICFSVFAPGMVWVMTVQGQVQDFDYITANGSITITGYHGPGGVVVIPVTINGLPVTTIGNNAFDSLSRVGSVTIPDGITSIGTSSFMYCALTNFDLAESVTNIGQMAFYGCSGLTSVTIPKGVKNLGVEAFGLCGALTNLTMESGLISLEEGAFFGCGGLTSVTLPPTVASLADGVFSWCSGLKSVSIPGPVTNFQGGMFDNCYSLTGIVLPAGINNIGWGTFADCGTLAQVTIPDSVTNIDDQAFAYCTSLTNIVIPKNVGTIGHFAFVGCTKLTGLSVESLNLVYSSADGSLFDKSQGTLVGASPGKTGVYDIPNGVTNVGPEAFVACRSLSSVTIPDSLTSVGPDAFEFFSGLSQIAIPNTVLNIGTNAFAGCTMLASMTIGSGVTNIEDDAFTECTNLHRAYFQGNAPRIGKDVFFNDYVLTVYYLDGTTGWTSVFGGRPAVLWNPKAQTNAEGFGVRQNRFGFNITGTPDIPLVVEASTNAAAGSWVSLQSGTLTNGLIYFIDPQWTNYPNRLYRIRSP